MNQKNFPSRLAESFLAPGSESVESHDEGIVVLWGFGTSRNHRMPSRIHADQPKANTASRLPEK
jgi:hypothetical protein